MKYSNDIDNNKMKGLSEYFEATKSEKVTFTADKAAKLIATAGAGTGSIGLLGKLLGKYYLKNLALSLGVVGAVGVTTLYLANTDKAALNNNKTSAAKVETNIDNSLPTNNSVYENGNDSKSLAKIDKSGLNIAAKSDAPKAQIKSLQNKTQLSNTELSSSKAVIDNSSNNSVALDKPVVKENKVEFPELLASNIAKTDYGLVPAQTTLVPGKVEQNSSFGNDNSNIGRLRIETLFGNAKINSFWLVTSNSFTKINGKLGLQSGGQLGWTMNNHVSMGLFGCGITEQVNITTKNNAITSIDTKKLVSSSGDLSVGYGGVFAEYSSGDSELAHYGVGLGLGVGASSASSSASADKPSNTFITAIPKAYVEANVFKWMKAGLAAEYRMNYSVYENDAFKTDPDLSKSSLSGMSFGLYFKFGFFDLK